MWNTHKKVLIRWCNHVLQPSNLALTDFPCDLTNGILLANLVETLSNQPIKGINTLIVKTRQGKVENVGVVFSFLKKVGLSLVNLTPEDIADGNERSCLALLWSIVLKYHLEGDDEQMAQTILSWLQKKLNLTNLGSDLRDGKQLCIFLDILSNGSYGIRSRISQHDFVGNCRMALEFAEVTIGVPRLFDAEDLVRDGDSQANLVYLMYFWEMEKRCGKIIIEENKEIRSRLTKEAENEVQRRSNEKSELESILKKRLDRNQSDNDVTILDDYVAGIKQSQHDKLRKVVDASKCIAHGPGVQLTGMVGVNQHFIIEARNRENGLTGVGGHPFIVTISAHSSKTIPLVVVDHENGKYTVQYCPPIPGSYRISVVLEGIHIEGSPFTVEIKNYKSIPAPLWYHKAKSEWVPFPEEFSDEIECIYQDLILFSAGQGSTCLSYKGVQYLIDFTSMKEVKRKDPLMRATWFWIDDDDMWRPFEALIGDQLEAAYQQNTLNNVVVSASPKRYVSQIGPDCFRQYRTTKHANPEGRPVQRGYMNRKLIPRITPTNSF